jgi:hypothetical protein
MVQTISEKIDISIAFQQTVEKSNLNSRVEKIKVKK